MTNLMKTVMFGPDEASNFKFPNIHQEQLLQYASDRLSTENDGLTLSGG